MVEGIRFPNQSGAFQSGLFWGKVVVIPDEGVVLDEQELMFSQSILALNHEGDCLGLGTPSPPLAIDNGTRIWNMSLLPVANNHLEDSNESIPTGEMAPVPVIATLVDMICLLLHV